VERNTSKRKIEMENENTIRKYLIPVTVRTEYLGTDTKGGYERISYLECANGEILTVSLPFDWAQYLAMIINRRHMKKLEKNYVENTTPLAVINIPGFPLQKTGSKIVAEDKKGMPVIMDSPVYLKSIENAMLLGEDLFIQRWTQLPINEPITITCVYEAHESEKYNLPLCNAWVLDLLTRLNIIKSDKANIVKNMDGSRFRNTRKEPSVYILIRKWVR
jgi:hypothetical protein